MSAKTLFTFVLMLFLTLPAAAGSRELFHEADEHRAEAMERKDHMASEALALLEEFDALNRKARELGIAASQLPEQDIARMRHLSGRLHELYAGTFYEASLLRDLALLDRLYETALFLHGEQLEHVRKTGSTRGFGQRLSELKLTREESFYLEILLYLQRLAPSELESNPGTPMPQSP